jgi:hypothetical protein
MEEEDTPFLRGSPYQGPDPFWAGEDESLDGRQLPVEEEAAEEDNHTLGLQLRSVPMPRALQHHDFYPPPPPQIPTVAANHSKTRVSW